MCKIPVCATREGSENIQFDLVYYILKSHNGAHKTYGIALGKTECGSSSGQNCVEVQIPFLTDSVEQITDFIHLISKNTVTPATLADVVYDYFYCA